MAKEKVLLISEPVEEQLVPHLIGKDGFLIKVMMRPFGVVIEKNKVFIYGFETTNLDKLQNKKKKWFKRAQRNFKKKPE